MPYITSAERIGMKKGALQAKREAVLEALKIRFQEVPTSIEGRINRVENPDTLKGLHQQAITTDSLAEFEQALTG